MSVHVLAHMHVCVYISITYTRKTLENVGKPSMQKLGNNKIKVGKLRLNSLGHRVSQWQNHD